jgi:hypothetical protein
LKGDDAPAERKSQRGERRHTNGKLQDAVSFFFFIFKLGGFFIFYFLRRERENDKVNTPLKMSVRSFRRSTTRRGEKTLPKRKSPVVVVVVVARLESIERNSY